MGHLGRARCSGVGIWVRTSREEAAGWDQQGGPNAVRSQLSGSREGTPEWPSGFGPKPIPTIQVRLGQNLPHYPHPGSPGPAWQWTCPRSGHMGFVWLPRAAIDPRGAAGRDREELPQPSWNRTSSWNRVSPQRCWRERTSPLGQVE